MAASNLNLGKASGGVLNIQPADGTTTTSIVLPASGTVTTNEYVNSNNLGNGSTTFNGFGGTGFKNLLINGGFDLWQRGTSQTISSTSGVYLADRWVTFVSGGGTATTSQIQTRYSNGGSKNTIRLTYGATGQTLFLEQRIEGGALLMAGKTYTLSFDVIGVGVTSLTIYSAESGTDLNITSSQAVPITGTLTRQSITFTVGSSFTAGDISRYIRFTTFSGNGTVGNYFEIGRVQLEQGSVATPFEQRPYGLELSLCQRYFQSIFIFNNISANQWIRQTVYLPVSMRTAPTLSTNIVNVGGTYYTCSLYPQTSNTNSFSLISSTGTVGGDLYYNATASAEL